MSRMATLLIPGGGVRLIAVNPVGVNREETADITIVGTGFRSGDEVSFGAGITVNSTTFVSSRELTANITASAAAAYGPRTLTLTRGTTTRTLANCLGVFATAPALPTPYFEWKASHAVVDIDDPTNDASGSNDPLTTRMSDLREHWPLSMQGIAGTEASGFVGDGSFAAPYALQCDGDTDCAYAANGTGGLDAVTTFPAKGAMEIAFLSPLGGYSAIFKWPYTATTKGFIISFWPDGSMRAYFAGPDATDTITIPGYWLEQWVHLLVTWDSSANTCTIFANGDKVVDGASVTNWPVVADARIGFPGVPFGAPAKIALARWYTTEVTATHAAALWQDVGRLWNAFSEGVKLSGLRPYYHAVVGETLAIPVSATGTYESIATDTYGVTFSNGALRYTPTFADGGTIKDVTVQVVNGAHYDAVATRIYTHHNLQAMSGIAIDKTKYGGIFAPVLDGATWHGLAQTQALVGIDHYTSTNLVDWTLVAEDVITAEEGALYLIHPTVIKVGSAWWIYTSEDNGDTMHEIWRTVTTDWSVFTKDDAPCVTNAIAGVAPWYGFRCPYVIKIGATYYLYCSWAGAVDDMALFSSPDGTTWTYVGICLPRYDLHWDNAKGQLDPCVIVNAAGAYEMTYAVFTPDTLDQVFTSAISADGVTWYPRGAQLWERPDSLGDVFQVIVSGSRRFTWSEREGGMSWYLGTGRLG